MAREGGGNSQAGASMEHRRHPRYAVDGDSAALLFVDLGVSLECKVIDLSLEGCRVRCRERLPKNAGVRAEVVFKVKGVAFRFSGVLRWTDGQQQAGIQFIDIIPRRRVDLAELIEEFEASAEKKCTKESAQPSSAGPDAATLLPAQQTHASVVPAAEPVPPPAAAAPPGAKSDRRAHLRHKVDTSATIILVRGGSSLAGHIVDLSLGGCCIQTRDKFPLGIYTRVETEFRLRGLPFRLGGVIQAVHHADTIGVRFLDTSDRKRQQITELIEEIQQAQSDPDSVAAPEPVPQATEPGA